MSGARKLMLSGIALIALLALVAVASHAHRPGGGTGAGPEHAPTLISDYVASPMMILLPFGAIFVIWGTSAVAGEGFCKADELAGARSHC